MSIQVFDYPPSVQLLQQLGQVSLKQKRVLPKALRLWVLLRSLYGHDIDDEVKLDLDDEFTYSDWRKKFFTDTHPKGDDVPDKHDNKCRCAKTLVEWLFAQNTGILEYQWRQSFQQHYPRTSEKDLNELLYPGRNPNNPSPIDCPFAVTRRTLQADLQTLVNLRWLERLDDNQYRKVQPMPAWGSSSQNVSGIESEEFLHPDLATLADNFFQPINGTQRFFMHVDYIVSRVALDKIRDLQDQLKRIWETTPVPPVRLIYNSASLWREPKRVVYPVCIYYFQRAPYLCAFGETPRDRSQMAWYHYRLDRIQDLTELAWSDDAVPQALRKRCQNGTPPSPDEIQQGLAAAWGFDFYRPSSLMLLRFKLDFHDRYIQDTIRHDTFSVIKALADAGKLIKKSALTQEQQHLLLQILQRFPDDAYYKANYRVDDNNVVMRLRAWGPNVEVLLPWDLRQRMTNDVKDTWSLYK